MAQTLKEYVNNTKYEEQNPATLAVLASLEYLKRKNPQIAQQIILELQDQRTHLKLIASENYSSLAVQLAMGNWLTDKYAEGYPFHRFYAGCDHVDALEFLAQEELKKIFGAQHAYVQPHSGADANLVAFWAILVTKIQNREVEKLSKKNLEELTPKEYEQIRQLLVNQKLMGMSLNSGGHLTHGYRHNISSKIMSSCFYEVDPISGMLDYSALQKQVKEENPTILLAGYSAYPRRINFAKMREIADSVGATFMVDMAHFAGLVAGKVFTGDYDPIPHAHVVTSTTHKTLRGPRGGFVLCTEEFAEAVNKGCPLVLGGPLPHIIAAKAVGFQEANTPEFQTYAHRIVENSQKMAERFIKRGQTVLTGGTDNHLLILDVSKLGVTGRQAEQALRESALTVNRNAIPNDKNGPWYTSGIRIGTPAMTTLGMGPEEAEEVADLIVEVLTHVTPLSSKAKYELDSQVKEKSQKKIQDLLKNFLLYPEIPLDI